MSWQVELQTIFNKVEDLLGYLELPVSADQVLLDPKFPIKVPKSFADRMIKKNWNCPLLKQVLPLAIEENDSQGVLDPLMESNFIYQKGVLKKFQRRVLVVASGHCAINCRYCFRRHFPYQDHRFSSKDWENLLENLKKDKEIREIILSGGDPLTLPDLHLKKIFEKINLIDHIQTIRVHTRLPIVIPSRLTNDFVELIENNRKKIVLVFHINHPNEISAEMTKQFQLMQRKGCIMFNQAVLLKGINDEVETQEALWRKCFDAGILAYYLHQFDDVLGARHFEVSLQQGLLLVDQLKAVLPGFMMPRYVKEEPFAHSKVAL